MKTPNIEQWAKAVWDAAPGNYRERVALIEELIPAIKAVAKAEKPIVRSTRWKRYSDEDTIVSGVIGKKITEIAFVHVLLADYPIKLVFVMEIAEKPTHPLFVEAKKFVQRHKLSVRGGVVVQN